MKWHSDLRWEPCYTRAEYVISFPLICLPHCNIHIVDVSANIHFLRIQPIEAYSLLFSYPTLDVHTV